MTNIPAFPQTMDTITDKPGMTLRDWFAGQALTGWLSDGVVSEPQYCAEFAYRMADAMLEARGDAA